MLYSSTLNNGYKQIINENWSLKLERVTPENIIKNYVLIGIRPPNTFSRDYNFNGENFFDGVEFQLLKSGVEGKKS